MAAVALRQIRAVIAVCEEGSFTRAAIRENATQSGISQHVAAVEHSLGVKLFERSASGVKPTPAGLRYYRRCVEAIGQIDNAHEEVRGFAGRVSGDLRIGLIPTVTRAALAPTLERFKERYPDVRLHIVEGYSGLLTDMVLAGDIDFAVVPTTERRVGLRSRLLVRDREMLVSGRQRGLTPLQPVRLKDCGPLKVIVPSRSNVRRRNIEVYFETHGAEVIDMIEMDAMIGTLEFVARTDWVAILSGLICIKDIGTSERTINPIYDPPLIAEFVVISPARRTLSNPARLFLEYLETEIGRIQDVWAKTIPPVVYPVRNRRPRGAVSAG
ncbi:MAG: LysR family transcriptional regulator [Alphaproteobacteria bacterium]|nr:LysR family transcriptional regulator [Alphaproteobacteria bacterium]